MGTYDHCFRDSAAQIAASLKSGELSLYDRWVKVINEVGIQIFDRYTLRPPTITNSVVIDGIRHAAWCMYRESWDNSYTIWLMTSGRYAITRPIKDVQASSVITFTYQYSYPKGYVDVGDVMDIGQAMLRLADTIGIEVDYDSGIGTRYNPKPGMGAFIPQQRSSSE